jgi:hypothetical protein
MSAQAESFDHADVESLGTGWIQEHGRLVQSPPQQIDRDQPVSAIRAGAEVSRYIVGRRANRPDAAEVPADRERASE